ncbi:hypothetical protein OG203_07640 [Nocardia sp. NBC_01499]|uniref:WXG100 family type VII secretion target n=1 Tax=Nocardia sp. NBC_01499 TaxID=2903597 RepID=UPI0038664041
MTPNEPPSAVPFGDWPSCWIHPGIKQTFDKVAADSAHGAATRYAEAGTKWSQGLETFRQRMQATIASAWEGAAASASVEAIKRYTGEADKLTGTFSAMSSHVNSAATAATDTKNGVPELIGDPPWYDLDGYPWNRAVLEGRRNDAEAEARDVMAQRYVAPFSQIHSTLPVLPHPTSVDHPLDISPTPSVDTGTSIDTGGKPPAPNNSGTSSTPEPGDQNTPSPSQTPAEPSTSTGQPESTTPASTTTTPASTSTTPTGYNPSTSQPSPPTVPASVTPTSATPDTVTGSPSRTSRPGSPGIPGAKPSAPPGPGRSIPGVRAVPGTVPAAAAASAAGRGAPGTPGMMAPGTGGGRGKDEESEHETPDYLINRQNTEELLGVSHTVISPVIGDGVPAASTAKNEDKPAPREATSEPPGPRPRPRPRPSTG